MTNHIESLAAYESGAQKLRAACAGLSTEQLNMRIAPGLWSIQEVVVHTLDSDLASTHRMRRMVAEQNPLLVAYDEDLFIKNIASEAADINEVLNLFDANRRFTLRWLRTLPQEAFARTGVHTQRGTVTLLQLVQIYSNHVDHHLVFVHGKRKAMGVVDALEMKPLANFRNIPAK